MASTSLLSTFVVAFCSILFCLLSVYQFWPISSDDQIKNIFQIHPSFNTEHQSSHISTKSLSQNEHLHHNLQRHDSPVPSSNASLKTNFTTPKSLEKVEACASETHCPASIVCPDCPPVDSCPMEVHTPCPEQKICPSHPDYSQLYNALSNKFEDNLRLRKAREDDIVRYIQQVDSKLKDYFDLMKSRREIQAQRLVKMEQIHIRQQLLINTLLTVREERDQYYAELNKEIGEQATFRHQISDVYYSQVEKNMIFSQDLNETRAAILRLEQRLPDVKRREERLSRLADDVSNLSAMSMTMKQQSDSISSFISTYERPVCQPIRNITNIVTVREEIDYDLLIDNFLLPTWEEEKLKTSRLVKSIICPLNPMVEYCFSDLQKHVHKLIDYAQRSAGAQVIQSLTSPTFKHTDSSSVLLSSVSGIADLLQIKMDNSVAPEVALSRDNSLGNCWPMSGSHGNFTVKLPQPVVISSVSIDHISM
jgi:hypothetical protein